jgi:hypothetical protein
VDAVGSLLLLGGILLSLAVAESWFWLVLVGFALVTAVYIAKGIHWLHTRRRSTI